MAQQHSTPTPAPQSTPAYRVRFWSGIKPQAIPANLVARCSRCRQAAPEVVETQPFDPHGYILAHDL